LLSLVVYQILNLSIPAVLFVPLFFISLAYLLYNFRQSWNFPRFPFLATFFIFMAVFIDSFSARNLGFSPKANQIFFLISVVFAGVYFFRDYRYYLSHNHIKFSVIFFLITLAYFLFYSSTFDISRVKYGYVLLIASGMEINSPPVKVIILTSSMGILVANILALAPFKTAADKRSAENVMMDKLLLLTYSLLAISLVAVVLGILSKAAKFNYGMHCYLPLMLTVGYSLLYFVQKYHAEARFFCFPFRLYHVLTVSLITSSIFLPLALNKTSLFSTFLIFTIFYWLTKGCGYGAFVRKILKIASEDLLLRIIIITSIIAIFILSAALGVFDLFADKVDYVISGLAKNSSMKVREGNWQYFLQYWWNSLNLQHIIAGYGIGASRETIFFISAMRDNAHERNLVQTVHNSYVEYLYDYGLMSIFYFGMYLVFLKNSLKYLFDKKDQDKLVLSSAQLALILFTGIYGLTDGIRVQMLIQLFVLLGFSEGLKNYYSMRAFQMVEFAHSEPIGKKKLYSRDTVGL
jgi:hypothetical protein